MKIFIFEYIEQLTNNYHSGGGLVVIAADKRDAKDNIEARNDTIRELEREWDRDNIIEITDDEWLNVLEYDLAIDYGKRIFIFRDAGCC